MPPVFGVWYHLRDTDGLLVTVILRNTMHSDDDHIVSRITLQESTSHTDVSISIESTPFILIGLTLTTR